MDELKLISANIKQMREEKGLSRKELALAIPISYDYLKKIEQGHQLVDSISLLKRIADGLGTSPQNLLPRHWMTENPYLQEALKVLLQNASEIERVDIYLFHPRTNERPLTFKKIPKN